MSGLRNLLAFSGGIEQAPSTQFSNIQFTFVEDTVVGIRGTRGDGAYILIVCKQGSAVDSHPVDGTSYTASSVFGSGSELGSGNFVVYKGSKTPATILDYIQVVTGLTENTTYHFRVYEFNGSGGSENYLTSTASGNPTSQTTQLPIYQTGIARYDFRFDNGWNSIPNLTLYDGNTNNVTYSNGQINRCINFTGTNSYVQVADAPALSFGNGVTDSPLTFLFWVKPTNLTTLRWLMSKRDNSSNDEYQVTIENTTGKIAVSLFSGGSPSNQKQWKTTNGISAGAWTSIAITYTGGNGADAAVKIYLNGVSETLTVATIGTYTAMTAGTRYLAIGQQSFSLTGSSGFLGSMDEVCLLSSALSQDQITWWHNSGAAREFFYNFDSVTNYEHHLYIICNRERWMMGTDNNLLYWSNDAGLTWTSYAWGTQYSANSAIYNKGIETAHIFDDGTALFMTAALIFRSVDGLATINSITPKGKGYLWTGNDSDNFLFHTPVDPTRPGNYFRYGSNACLTYSSINGREVLVFGNDGNIAGGNGAAPTLYWYTADYGATVKAMYMYGQNTDRRDDGSTSGGATGTLLGNASNALIVNHDHQIVNRPGTNEWYSCTGDFTGQIQWIKHEYDAVNDTWTHTNIITNENGTTKFQGTGFQFPVDGEIYWTSYTSSGTTAEQGLWKDIIANLAAKNPTKIVDLGNARLTTMMLANDRLLIVGEGANFDTQFAVLESLGTGAVNYYPITGKTSAIYAGRIFPPNAKGFVLIGLGGLAYNPQRTSLYKL